VKVSAGRLGRPGRVVPPEGVAQRHRRLHLRGVAGVLSVLVLGAAGAGGAPAASAVSGFGASLRVTPGPGITGPGSGYQLATERMPDGKTLVLRWNPCQTITYKVNVAALPASLRPVVLAEVRTAAGRLAAASGLTLAYRGTTSQVPRSTTLDQQSAEIIIAATTRGQTDFPIGGRTLGFGGRSWYWWWYDDGTKVSYGAAVTRGFVVLDAAGLGSLRPGFGRGLDRGNLIMHELGHAAGLDHAGSRASLMYPELAASAPDGYGPGDRAGLARLGRAAGCVTIPVQLPSPDLT
jgi:hypothetical protein